MFAKRRLGTSELEITPVVFGAWAIGGWMWGGADDEEAISAIRAAIDHGVNIIDTAAIYGMGHSEKLVAKAIKGKRDSVIVATKCGMRWDTNEGSNAWESTDNEGRKVTIRRFAGPKSIIEECENSLRRLEVDVIDLYQIHWPDLTTPPEASMEAMMKLKEQGKIRAIGVSNYDVEWMTRAATAGHFDSLQPPYSILRRDIEKEIVPHCQKKNIGIICYSPMERGLLTGAVPPERVFQPGDHRAAHPYFTPERRAAVQIIKNRLQPLCEKHQASMAQLVIAWTIRQPGITGAIVGARNAEQAAHNAEAMRIEMSEADLKSMEQIFQEEWR